MKLWKKTFRFSDDYISLVFDSGFDGSLVEYETYDGEVIAAVMGVPYSFGNAEKCIKSLFLCGVATDSKFRSQGFMTKLLQRINDRARAEGYAFTFLIPYDEGLREFFHDRDYVNAFYRVTDNYTSLHDFDLEYESVLAEQKDKVVALKKKYFESLRVGSISAAQRPAEGIVEALRKLIHKIEDTQLDLQVIHTDKDIENVILENAMTGGSVFYTLNSSEEVTAVAFTSVEEDAVVIHKIYATDAASKFKVLGAVKRAFPDRAIRHYISSIEMDRNALWSRTYGSFMPESPQVDTISVTERVYSLAAHAKMYGMARILDLHEILRFQASIRKDLKYSILMKSPSEEGKLVQFDARDGNVKVKTLSYDQVEPSKLAYLMTQRDISEILFRRRDTDNLITEAFGIPSINGSICLMLD